MKHRFTAFSYFFSNIEKQADKGGGNKHLEELANLMVFWGKNRRKLRLLFYSVNLRDYKESFQFIQPDLFSINVASWVMLSLYCRDTGKQGVMQNSKLYPD